MGISSDLSTIFGKSVARATLDSFKKFLDGGGFTGNLAGAV